jgi:hypothetical protein
MSGVVVNLDEFRRSRTGKPYLPDPPSEAIAFVRRPGPLSEREREFIASVVRFCLAYPERLTAWKRGFLHSMAGWPRAPSDKQRQALNRILDKIERIEGLAL